jgi:hypothetical protein
VIVRFLPSSVIPFGITIVASVVQLAVSVIVVPFVVNAQFVAAPAGPAPNTIRLAATAASSISFFIPLPFPNVGSRPETAGSTPTHRSRAGGERQSTDRGKHPREWLRGGR